MFGWGKGNMWGISGDSKGRRGGGWDIIKDIIIVTE